MKRFPPEPVRLLDLRPQDDPANLAHLVRSAVKAPEDPLPRVKWRIRSTLRRKSEWRRRFLRVAFVGGMIFLTGGVVGAVVRPILGLRAQPEAKPVQDVRPSAPPARRGHSRVRPPLPGAADEALPPESALDPMRLPEAAEPSTSADFSYQQDMQGVQPLVLQLKQPTSLRSPLPRTATPSSVPAEPVVKAEKRTLPRAAGSPEMAHPLSSLPPSLSSFPASRADAIRHASSDSAPLRIAMIGPPRVEPKLPDLHTASGLVPPRSPAASPLLPPAQPFRPWGEGPQPNDVVPGPAPLPPATAVKPAASLSEQALLARALRSLRSEHRPESALVALDDYTERFPNGTLLPEAMRLRTEALLVLGHKHAALDELDQQSIDGMTGSEERRLLRGELRAAAGRWQAAVEDFDAILRARLAYEQASNAPALTKLLDRVERALWGRASARSHLGDEAGARADLRECLRRFPQGRFAERAARLLGALH